MFRYLYNDFIFYMISKNRKIHHSKNLKDLFHNNLE